MIYVLAALIILGTLLINYRGILISGRVQLAVIVAIVGLLLTAVIASAPLVRVENFTPFFSYGILTFGVAAALIFWSYLGYENVSNVAEGGRLRLYPWISLAASLVMLPFVGIVLVVSVLVELFGFFYRRLRITPINTDSSKRAF